MSYPRLYVKITLFAFFYAIAIPTLAIGILASLATYAWLVGGYYQ